MSWSEVLIAAFCGEKRKGTRLAADLEARLACMHLLSSLMVQFPVIPGHEVVGPLAAVGKNVTHLKVGDRVVADVSETCGR
jgi:threonine dehydrogenase-like Zn-dependent dehydrogenase